MTRRRAQFVLSFAAIVATAFCFILRAMVVDGWGRAFALSETQKGELLGAGLWPFAITIILFGLIVDRIGFRWIFWFAAAAHLVGLALLLAADGYPLLYAGTFVMALGNGAVEAAANPLVATIYAEDKPRWLNRLHAAWPGGIVLGGLLAIALGSEFAWQVKVAAMIAPGLVYVVLLLRVEFPLSERIASGVTDRTMFREVGWFGAFIVLSLVMMEVGRLAGWPIALSFAIAAIASGLFALAARRLGDPFFVLLLLLMVPLAVTELSTDSWIASLMAPEFARAGVSPGWILIYAALIMFFVRLVAGSVVARFTPPGTIALAAAAASAGLFLFSAAHGVGLLLAATLYGIGKSFFWGTMLAMTSERVPRGGALAMNMVAGAGMLGAGIIGTTLLGLSQDLGTTRAIAAHDAAHATHLASRYVTTKEGGFIGGYSALDAARVARASPDDEREIAAAQAGAKKIAIGYLAWLPLLLAAIFGVVWAVFRRQGGYRPDLIGSQRP